MLATMLALGLLLGAARREPAAQALANEPAAPGDRIISVFSRRQR
jgi:hypothetical protein